MEGHVTSLLRSPIGSDLLIQQIKIVWADYDNQVDIVALDL